MPRRASIWPRKEDGFYYTTHRGKQVKLSQDFQEARKLFHTLKAGDEAPADRIAPSFRKLADLHLDELQRSRAPDTYTLRRIYLQSFLDHLKKGKRADALKPLDVTEWLAGHDWSESTRTTCRTAVKTCLSWAVKQGILKSNPLALLETGSYGRRDRVLSLEERRKIKDAAPPEFQDFLTALEQTGARPFSELAKLTARMIDWKSGTIALAKHKNAGKGKKRTIYLTPELTLLLQKLSLRHPEGTLFRNTLGNPWNDSNTRHACRKIERDAGVDRFNLYAYRHTYISEALERGITVEVVAEICGNSPATIYKHYHHVIKRELYKEAAARAAM